MIIKFRIISGEKSDFVRDIEIYDDNTFLDLHKAIQAACDYDPAQLATFIMSNDNWDSGQEIILEKLDPDEQKDILLMNDVRLFEQNPKKSMKIIYIFDFFSIRSFFLEVVNVRKPEKEDKNLEYPICTLSKGKPPNQTFVDNIEDFGIDGIDDFDDDISLDNIDDYDI